MPITRIFPFSVLFSALLAASPVSWANKGMLKIVTDPGDARIYVNGKRKGNSPSKAGQTFAIKLEEGEYKVEAVKRTGGPNELFGVNNDIFVSEDSMQTITLTLKERPSQPFPEELALKYKNGVPLPEMVTIPGGSFKMGCVSGEKCGDDEKPVHSVNIPAFQMSKTEVTFEQWDACVADRGCDHYPSDKGWGRGNHPVINVSWDDIQSYINWLNKKTGDNYRLPSEAEWEYAARAGSSTLYSWGSQIGINKANCDGCGSQWDNSKTAPVGSFSASAFGLFDMHGNVWEWTLDCWNNNYQGAPSNGKPRQEGSCERRVLRGGSWFSEPGDLRSAFRDEAPSDGRYSSYGFRLARAQ